MHNYITLFTICQFIKMPPVCIFVLPVLSIYIILKKYVLFSIKLQIESEVFV